MIPGFKVTSHFFAGAVCKVYCPALVNKSTSGQGTLVSISRNIIHGTEAAALVTKSFSNQDKGSISLLLAVGQISSNVQSLGYAIVSQIFSLLSDLPVGNLRGQIWTCPKACMAYKHNSV